MEVQAGTVLQPDANMYVPPRSRSLGWHNDAGQTQDNFYAQVHLTGDASVTLCAGACSTQQGKAGINRFSQPLTPGQGVSVEVRRNGQVTARLSPAFTFQANSDRYNFSQFSSLWYRCFTEADIQTT